VGGLRGHCVALDCARLRIKICKMKRNDNAKGARKLFKYCPVTNYSLANLENNQLFLNYYAFFNDPFECMCEVFYGFPKLTDRSERLMNVLNAWGFDDPDESLVLEHYGEYADSLEEGEPIIEYYIENARIGCFSRSDINMLMWAHYADGMRGYCIEFDRETMIPEKHDARIYDVLYKDKPSVIDSSVMAVLIDQRDYNEDAFFDTGVLAKYHGDDRSAEIEIYEEGFKVAADGIREIYQRMLATKPVSWSYEEELRIIDFAPRENNNGVLMSYPVDAVKSIILGERMSPLEQEAIKKIARDNNPNVRIKMAVRVAGSFEINLIDLV
jgi:Protein of unknown function (DUF2971)